MIKIYRLLALFFIIAAVESATAQTTTSSPYSQFALGDIYESQLPQTRALGGITAGYRKPGFYNEINSLNPASYSAINLTTIDVGMYNRFNELSKNNLSENSYNASLSHLAFGVPVGKKAAISFGLFPFSEVGYQYTIHSKLDTTNVDYVYSGDGGLSNAYLGYGIQLGKHLSVGANLSYVFGNLKRDRSTVFTDYGTTAMNSRTENALSVGGLGYSYGIQYFANLSPKVKLTLGYSGNAGKDIRAKNTITTTHYYIGQDGVDSAPIDTTYFLDGGKINLTMPMTHTIGFTIEKNTKWLFGADFDYKKWSDYREGNTDPGFNDSYGVRVGTQITPDATSVTNYFKVIDYRLGFKYDKTYLNLNNTDIDQVGLTFGFGFPLPQNRSSIYKINLSAELGQRGTLDNNLVRERFLNLHIGFTLNDKWFIKPKYD